MSEITLPKSNFNHVCYHDHEGRSFLRFVGRLPHQIVILPHFELQDIVALKINILDILQTRRSPSLISGDQSRDKLNDCPFSTSARWSGRTAQRSTVISSGLVTVGLLGAVPSPNGRGQDAQMHPM